MRPSELFLFQMLRVLIGLSSLCVVHGTSEVIKSGQVLYDAVATESKLRGTSHRNDNSQHSLSVSTTAISNNAAATLTASDGTSIGYHLRNLQSTNAITKVELVNTITDKFIGTVTDGMTIVLDTYGLTSPSQINFVFQTGSDTKSVAVTYQSLAITSFKFSRFEDVAPYTLCGDIAGDFTSCKSMQFGLNRITAKPYTLAGTMGTAGTELIYSFTVVQSGVGPPLPAPVSAPVNRPVAIPTVKQPATVPTSPSSCGLPKLVGSWKSYPTYPISIGEGEGAILENGDFVLYSGFTNSFGQVTKLTYAYDTTKTTSVWRKMDDLPLPNGISHCAYAVNGNVLYTCGGYNGKHPGPGIKNCLKFTGTNPSGTQWSTLPALPAERAGGGMIFDSASNTLLYATGASRPDPERKIHTVDHDDVWELNLNNLNAGWQTKPKIPYKGNHMGFVTVKYQGKERHYFHGGQFGEKENDTNQNLIYEWNQSTNQWIQRQNLPIGRGHYSSSVVPYKECGFLIFGGRYNSGPTSDVTYYDIENDSWTNIGRLPEAIKTPVCDISGGVAYCQTGRVGGSFSYKIDIV